MKTSALSLSTNSKAKACLIACVWMLSWNDASAAALRQRRVADLMPCTRDLQKCKDGSFVARNPDNACEFFPCPDASVKAKKAPPSPMKKAANTHPLACTRDLQTCRDRSVVTRDPDNGCQFFPCPDESLKGKKAPPSNDKGAASVCGDGLVQGREDCDGAELAGIGCIDLGFTGGELQCTDACTFSTLACTTCGDGVRDFGELCDTDDLNGFDCTTLGYAGGSLSCDDMCGFDTSYCHACGDGIVNGEESCDLLDLNGKSCQDFGFAGGSLSCDSSCGYDTSGCRTANPSASPSMPPSGVPSSSPSTIPSSIPSTAPSLAPSIHPSASPSMAPSAEPSQSPSKAPSHSPSMAPTSPLEDDNVSDINEALLTEAPTSMETASETDSMAPMITTTAPTSTMTMTTAPTSSVENTSSRRKAVTIWQEDFGHIGADVTFERNLFKDISAEDSQMEGDHSSTKYGKWRNGVATGGLRLTLSNVAGVTGDVSAGWTASVNVEEEIEHAIVTFQYRVDSMKEWGQNRGEVLVGVDDTAVTVVESLDGSSQDVNVWKLASVNVGPLMPGVHTIKIGGYLMYSNMDGNETHEFQIRFDHFALKQKDD